MRLIAMLRENTDELVESAAAELHRAHLAHYEKVGLEATRERISALVELTFACLEAGSADPVTDWASRVGRERYDAGYDLLELQVAVNIVEEAFSQRILASIDPENVARYLGLVSAILGMAKDALARTYVSLATEGEPAAPVREVPDTGGRRD